MSAALLHITPRQRWMASLRTGEYRASSLEAEGFIHCSTLEQLLIPANERFRGVNDLVVLVIDPDELDADVVFEDLDDRGTDFPHVYGPIPVGAVTDVVGFPPGPDGRFRLPSELG